MTVTEDQRTRGVFLDVHLARRLLARELGSFDPDAVLLGNATELWVALDQVERLASNAKTILAGRVEESASWQRAGARSAADHLARLGGRQRTWRAAR